MALTLSAIIILVISSLLSVLFQDESRKTVSACLGTSLASIIGFSSAFMPLRYLQEGITFSTNIPDISFSFGIDPLSRFFLIIIFGISFLIGLYGFSYIHGQKRLVTSVPFFPLLVAAMAGVVISRDGFSFLIIWEMMSLSSFFLVTAEHENKEAQNAGWIYLIAMHLATAFLMAFFVIMAKANGSFLFKDFVADHSPFLAGLLFVFAVIGFGTKAGIFPLHIWLPHAHPSAPSYISALMSGVMIKTGIYGILRALTFLGAPPLWWGGLLIAIGVLSSVMGVLYALMQHDLKRLLAYHSVENIGIIVVGIGAGLIGLTQGNKIIMGLGFGGALFHVLNHAIFKSLLFLCAGNIMHTVHSLLIDRLGGLGKKLPMTGLTFLVAAMSICGLPPFNGFISEWIIYAGLFTGAQSFVRIPILLSVAGILGIAFAGGLAIVCFAKVFGVIFLGEARSDIAKGCHEPPPMLTFPTVVLAMLCIMIGLAPKFVWSIISPVFQVADVGGTLSSLTWISSLFALLIILTGLLLLIRKFAFRKKESGITVTWDCGYSNPTPKMQYTASSFAEPIGTFFRPILNPSSGAPEGHIHDYAEERIFNPAFKTIGSMLLFIRNKKKSTIQHYLALIFISLIVLFVLEVWFGI